MFVLIYVLVLLIVAENLTYYNVPDNNSIVHVSCSQQTCDSVRINLTMSDPTTQYCGVYEVCAENFLGALSNTTELKFQPSGLSALTDWSNFYTFSFKNGLTTVKYFTPSLDNSKLLKLPKIFDNGFINTTYDYSNLRIAQLNPNIAEGRHNRKLDMYIRLAKWPESKGSQCRVDVSRSQRRCWFASYSNITVTFEISATETLHLIQQTKLLIALVQQSIPESFVPQLNTQSSVLLNKYYTYDSLSGKEPVIKQGKISIVYAVEKTYVDNYFDDIESDLKHIQNRQVDGITFSVVDVAVGDVNNLVQNSGYELSGGAIVGILIAVLIVVGVIAGLSFWYFKHRRHPWSRIQL